MKQNRTKQDLTGIDSLLQPDDIAHMLGVSVHRVRSWIADGHIQRLPGTRNIHVTVAALEAFLASEHAA